MSRSIPTRTPRWRLHPACRSRSTASGMQLELAGRRWRIDQLSRTLTRWITLASTGFAEAPAHNDSGFEALVEQLTDHGLLQPERLDEVLLLDGGAAARGISAVLAHHTRVRRIDSPSEQPSTWLPDRALLENFAGLVVANFPGVDPALGWLLHACGNDHVLVEMSPETVRCGLFFGGRGCHGCDIRSQRGRLVDLSAPPPLRPAPGWMQQWLAAQVGSAVQRWRHHDRPLAEWVWMKADGTAGVSPVRPHAECCGAAPVAA